MIPRKVRLVADPSDFSMATGMPSSRQTRSMVDMESWQVGSPGGPSRRKPFMQEVGSIDVLQDPMDNGRRWQSC